MAMTCCLLPSAHTADNTFPVKTRAKALRRTGQPHLPSLAIRRKAARAALARSRAGDATVTCHDLTQHLCGSLKNGPSDLSTNPKYMEGFGQ